MPLSGREECADHHLVDGAIDLCVVQHDRHVATRPHDHGKFMTSDHPPSGRGRVALMKERTSTPG